jgi:hypothetical protein
MDSRHAADVTRGFNKRAANGKQGGCQCSCSTITVSFLAIVWVLVFPLQSMLSGVWPSGRHIDDFLVNQQLKEISLQHDGKPQTTKSRSAGFEVMRESNATIIGVAKNIADRLPFLLRQVDHLSQLFSFSQAIFVEGDSTDQTYQVFR